MKITKNEFLEIVCRFPDLKMYVNGHIIRHNELLKCESIDISTYVIREKKKNDSSLILIEITAKINNHYVHFFKDNREKRLLCAANKNSPLSGIRNSGKPPHRPLRSIKKLLGDNYSNTTYEILSVDLVDKKR